jgi:ubiquinone/menaquinone biosynthesis C-methylase UbiE
VSREHSTEVARVFDSWAREGRDEGMAERHGLSARPVLDELAIEPGDRFLDLGAGNAWAATWAQAAGASGVAVDVSTEMLARAREREQAPASVQASFEQLPFAEAAFAFVFSMEALYYAEDLDRALAEAHRVCEPGGRLDALVDYYEGNPESEGWPEKTGVDMHRLSPEGWREAVEQAGFTAVTTDRIRSDDGEGWRAEHGSLHVHGRKR